MRTVTPCIFVYRFQCFCLEPAGQKRKARGFSEVLIATYQRIQHHISEYSVSVVTSRPMRTSRFVLSNGRFKSIDIKTNFHILTSTFTCNVKRLMQLLFSLVKAGQTKWEGGCRTAAQPPPPQIAI